MIKCIYIDNYRCLVNFELQLNDLTLLVGPNGVGKTSVLDVMFALRQLLSGEGSMPFLVEIANGSMGSRHLFEAAFQVRLQRSAQTPRVGVEVLLSRQLGQSCIQPVDLALDLAWRKVRALPPLPEEAGAKPGPPRQGERLRTHNDGQRTIKGITKEIGQHVQEQYSSRLGGFIFDALLAHFSVSVSTLNLLAGSIPTRPRWRELTHETAERPDGQQGVVHLMTHGRGKSRPWLTMLLRRFEHDLQQGEVEQVNVPVSVHV